MSRKVSFSVSEEEYGDILDYVAAKKRWGRVSHFVRHVVFTEMERNPAGGHRAKKGAGVPVLPAPDGHLTEG